MTGFEYDPEMHKPPEPDRELLVRAHRHMLRGESDFERYIRQQWETTFGATRVGLDAWRTLWPHHAAYNFSEGEQQAVMKIEAHLAQAYFLLDQLMASVQGDVMRAAQLGTLTAEDMDELEAMENAD